ncbi:hypothetical protein MGAST_30115 [Mycobacterium gastri 'Wayne']|nr:hypothetical protein MGAST_30115 [Mycobacterium gastri 'Wayne']
MKTDLDALLTCSRAFRVTTWCTPTGGARDGRSK